MTEQEARDDERKKIANWMEAFRLALDAEGGAMNAVASGFLIVMTKAISTGAYNEAGGTQGARK